ncbi:MAG: hypothetical protein ACI37U_07100 [Bacteroides sp.]
MANVVSSNISAVDALWTLIQSQTQSVRDALYHRMIEAEKSRETQQQKKFIRESLNRAITELKDAQLSNKELPNARDLFKHMDEE